MRRPADFQRNTYFGIRRDRDDPPWDDTAEGRQRIPWIDHTSGRFRGRFTGPPRPCPGNRQETCRLILLDHNIPQSEVQLLRRWRIHCRQVGYEVGRPEWDDAQEILRYLQRSRKITFFTRDIGFFRRRLCHKNYCIVVLTGPPTESALWIRRFLKHPEFRTQALRYRRVVKLTATALNFWQLGRDNRQKTSW